MTLGSMDHGEGSVAQLIQLEPLIHQVSGHSSLWVLDDVTVCKPLIGREAKFYRTLPPQMRAFTPEFRGTLKVLVQRTAEGVAVAALPPNPGEPRPPYTQTARHHNSGRSRRVPSLAVDLDGGVEVERGEGQEGGPSSASSHLPPAHNPWLQQCHQRYLTKLRLKGEATTNVMECILLENLTHVYRVPNVLDLKMGTRQYGDDAPESKRRSQTRKAQHTTTPRLGVRLAGMQVFNRDTKCYVCKNKYVGRELTEDGFQQTLRHFLHNGRRFRTDIVEQIICKLTDLRKVVASLDSFRFFTSSLLILYDSYDSKGSYKVKDTSIAVDNDKHTDQENRNKSRDRNERRLESVSSEIQSGSESRRSNENNLSSALDSKGREPLQLTDAVSGRPDLQPCQGSKLSNNDKNTAKCDEACITCGGKGCHYAKITKQKPNQHRSSIGNTNSFSCLSSVSECSYGTDNLQIRKHSQEQFQLQQPQQQQPKPLQQRKQSQDTVLSSGKECLSASPSNPNFVSNSDQGPISSAPILPSSGGARSSSLSSVDGQQALDNSSASAVTAYRTKVDIRLIDFAHATHRGMGDPTVYSGPDEGLMLGLKSLINIFTDIKDFYTK